MTGLIETLNRVLDVTLFRLGETAFTVWTLLYLTIFLAVLFYLSGVIRHWLISQVLSRTTLPLGERDAVGSIFRYVVIVIGLLIAVQAAFAHQNLTFPYPQRDIHIRNVPIDLKPESKVTASS